VIRRASKEEVAFKGRLVHFLTQTWNQPNTHGRLKQKYKERCSEQRKIMSKSTGWEKETVMKQLVGQFG
jgi:hypothetical protein